MDHEPVIINLLMVSDRELLGTVYTRLATVLWDLQQEGRRYPERRQKIAAVQRRIAGALDAVGHAIQTVNDAEHMLDEMDGLHTNQENDDRNSIDYIQ